MNLLTAPRMLAKTGQSRFLESLVETLHDMTLATSNILIRVNTIVARMNFLFTKPQQFYLYTNAFSHINQK